MAGITSGRKEPSKRSADFSNQAPLHVPAPSPPRFRVPKHRMIEPCGQGCDNGVSSSSVVFGACVFIDCVLGVERRLQFCIACSACVLRVRGWIHPTCNLQQYLPSSRQTLRDRQVAPTSRHLQHPFSCRAKRIRRGPSKLQSLRNPLLVVLPSLAKALSA